MKAVSAVQVNNEQKAMFVVVSQSDVKTFDRNTLKMKAVKAI